MSNEQRILALAEAIFRLVKSELNLASLESYRDVVFAACEVIDKSSPCLHPDLGDDLAEYYTLRLGNNERFAHQFGDAVASLLEAIAQQQS